MGYRYKASKSKIREFKLQMEAIDSFCEEHNIKASNNNDSYYFNVNGQDYRVSNHTVDCSNAGAYDEQGNQVRNLYHLQKEFEETIYYTAGKTRLIEVYNNILSGKELNKRGQVK